MFENPLFQLVINVLLVMLVIAIPIITLIILMEFFDKYKKRKDAIKLEAERIIVKMAEDVDKKTTSIKVLENKEQELKSSVYDLEKTKRELELELINDSEDDGSAEDIELAEDDDGSINYYDLTVKELQDLARQLNIVGFSRMKKQKLIEKLSNFKIEDIINNTQDHT